MLSHDLQLRVQKKKKMKKKKKIKKEKRQGRGRGRGWRRHGRGGGGRREEGRGDQGKRRQHNKKQLDQYKKKKNSRRFIASSAHFCTVLDKLFQSIVPRKFFKSWGMARTRNLSLKHPTGLNVSPKTKRYSLVMQPDHRTTKQGLKLANNSWLLKFKSSD